LKINKKKFIELIKKATLNYSINTLQINIDNDRIKVAMKSESNTYLTVLDLENDIFIDIISGSLLELNFLDPNVHLLKLLNQIDLDEPEIKLNNKILSIIDKNQKASVNFCSPLIVSVSNKTTPRINDYFLNFDIDDNFNGIYKKIRSIGAIYGKVYFEVIDNKFRINSTDKTSGLDHGFMAEIIDVKHENISCCFPFLNISNMMNCLSDDKEYEMKFAYEPNTELMMISCIRKDTINKEIYYLFSQKDI